MNANSEKLGVPAVHQTVFRLGVFAAIHPIEYAKILIQIGFEPIQPKPTRTLLGRPALSLPNVFQYIGYIRKKKGFFGLYHGVAPRVCGNFVHTYVSERITKLMPLQRRAENGENGNEGTEDKVLYFFQHTGRSMVSQCVAIIASQPFQVITVRMVAQFVGGEKTYNGIFSSIREIYAQEGISGFFSGLVPRIVGDLLLLWLSSCLTFVINTYLIKDKDLQSYTEASMSFIASAVTYPFLLVSRVMTVNNSGLVAGMPPQMPIYISWTDCWSHLKAQNQLKRGSSLLWRYYTGPYILKDGKPHVPSLQNFKMPLSTKYN